MSQAAIPHATAAAAAPVELASADHPSQLEEFAARIKPRQASSVLLWAILAFFVIFVILTSCTPFPPLNSFRQWTFRQVRRHRNQET